MAVEYQVMIIFAAVHKYLLDIPVDSIQAVSYTHLFTINMLVPIFLCGFLGIWIHRTFGIPAEIPLFFLGALAGFRNVYIMAKSVYEDDKGAKKK